VSCTSTSFCAAVGFVRQSSSQSYPAFNGTGYYGPNDGGPLQVIDTDGSWSAKSNEPASGTPAGPLYGVSCTSSVFCVAVGDYNVDTEPGELGSGDIETFDGTD